MHCFPGSIPEYSYEYKGCYEDVKNARDLSGWDSVGNVTAIMTLEKCAEECIARGTILWLDQGHRM